MGTMKTAGAALFQQSTHQFNHEGTYCALAAFSKLFGCLLSHPKR